MNIIFKSLGSFSRVLFLKDISRRFSRWIKSAPVILRSCLVLLSLVIVLFLKFVPTISAAVVDKVVAVVNDVIITQNDVEKSLKPISAQYAAIYSGDEFLQKLAEAKKNIINKLIENKLILAEAESMAIEISDEEAEARVERLIAQFPSRDEFETVLLEQGLRISDLKENYRNQIAIQRVVNYRVKSRIVVKPAEIVDHYYAHLDEFTQPRERKVLHILIRAKERVSLFRTHQRARKALGLIKGGTDFAQVVRDYSDGPQRNAGGDLGFIGPRETMEEIDKAIFELKVGEVSGLIKSELGYHIIKVEDQRLSYIKDLDQVQSEIENILFQEKMKSNFQEWISKLKKDAYISIKEE